MTKKQKEDGILGEGHPPLAARQSPPLARQPDDAGPEQSTRTLRSAHALVALQGPHPATLLGLDLDADHDEPIAEWLVASILLGGRVKEPVALEAWRRLAKAELATPQGVARAGGPAIHAPLEEAGLAKSQATAAVLVRVCRALMERHAGSLDALAAGADGLEDLAGRLARLGAGFGPAAVLRFLTPLRDRWTAANDLPVSAATFAAARHLGWIADSQDEEGAPASLARWLSSNEPPRNGTARNDEAATDVEVSSPALRDVEAALDRLGRAACLRERSDRCPLQDSCPQRATETGERTETGEPTETSDPHA